jgi:signal transduction histidine kinase/CheY-like chemotaxis protein
MVSIHRQALLIVAGDGNEDDAASTADRATTFLAESLAAFEMAQEGYRVTSARLLETKEELERGALTLAATNQALESEIAQRTAAEEAARHAQREAERANRSKSEFLSRMSHELRTPLNSILGFGQVLELSELDADQLESVTQVLAAGRHLLGLIDEILDISRIETGRIALSVEPVSVSEVVSQAVDMVSPIAAAKDVVITVDREGAADTFVNGDRQRLTQALLNVLSNAVKYNHEGGSVRISWTEDTDRLTIRIRDSGVGIAEDKLARAFQPFDRLGAEETAVEGTGLGLALSKHLLEAMGAELRIEESTVGVGTTFALDLPIVDDPVARFDTGPSDIVRSSSAAGVVVYVEDNLSNLRLIERLLVHRPGVELVSAKNGHSGWELIRETQPDLVLLDLHLPDMPGREVLERLKADPATRDIPVVVLSADALTEQRRELIAAGARYYLTKPIEVSELFEVLDEILTPAPLPPVE